MKNLETITIAHLSNVQGGAVRAAANGLNGFGAGGYGNPVMHQLGKINHKLNKLADGGGSCGMGGIDPTTLALVMCMGNMNRG